jgi:hypothetical protein
MIESKICPFCKTPMKRLDETIPAWFDPFAIIEMKRPALWRLVKTRLTGDAYRSGVDLVNEEIHLYQCESCGFYGLFDSSIDKEKSGA